MNATVRGNRRSPRGDPWQAFDELPKPLRDAMQDGVSPLCPLKVRAAWRAACRRYSEGVAIAHVLQLDQGRPARRDVRRRAAIVTLTADAQSGQRAVLPLADCDCEEISAMWTPPLHHTRHRMPRLFVDRPCAQGVHAVVNTVHQACIAAANAAMLDALRLLEARGRAGAVAFLQI